ncbi:hypothetical protein ACFL6Q_07055 [Candidatus Neomarinimicrobiota bacterium]
MTWHRPSSPPRTIISIILLVWSVLGTSTLNAQWGDLDTLRQMIAETDTRLDELARDKLVIAADFKQLNDQIYRYKQKEQEGSGIWLTMQLKSALKAARRLADQIEIVEDSVKKVSDAQVSLYNQAIAIIDRRIQAALEKVETQPEEKETVAALMTVISSLSEDRDRYTARLMAIESDQWDWRSIQLSADDSYNKIKLKTIILVDEYESLKKVIDNESSALETVKKNKASYEDMLMLYRVLEEDTDEEQEYFDRHQIIEMRSRLSALSGNILHQEQEITRLTDQLDSLEVKITGFREALAEPDVHQDE